MEADALTHAEVDVPAHVPSELVRPFDFISAEMQHEPHALMATLQSGPPVFFNPVNSRPDGGKGFWVVTRSDDLRSILQRPEIFSNRQIARFSSLMGESWDLIPAEKDPPEHGKFRRILNPLFSPPAVKKWEDRIRSQAVELIDSFSGKGECEFVEEFSKPFPIRTIMRLLGLPLESFDDVLAWGHDLHDGDTMEQRSRGAVAIGDFLRAEITRARTVPNEGAISTIVNAEVDGRPLQEDEILGIMYLLFTGGIHTVTASLGFAARHLARDQALQERLRRNPADIPVAMDELLRVYSVVNSFRRVVADVEIGGVAMKPGDWVFNTLPLANLDPSTFSNPLQVDIDRPNLRHMGFSFGVHFCLGAHLAKLEMIVAWQEILARIPTFSVREETTHLISGPTLLGVHHLDLVWDAA